MLSVSDAEKLVHAFMTSRLDYCNALLGGCPASSINKLQIVQNAVAEVLTRSRKYDHITLQLYSLYTGYLEMHIIILFLGLNISFVLGRDSSYANFSLFASVSTTGWASRGN